MELNIDKWIGCYKVRAINWIDNKTMYLNLQYFKSGSSINNPVWDKTVYITINEKGINVINNFIDSLVNHVANLKIEKDEKVVLTF